VLVALVGPLVVRALVEGRAELELAGDARAAGRNDAAIEHYGRALRWRVPLASHDEQAIAQLRAMADAAEGAGDVQEALAALRELRRGLIGTRAWAVPHPDELALANARIAELMAAQEREFGTDIGGEGDPYAWHLARLEALPGPDPVRANLAAFAFVGWLAAVAAFFVRGLDARGYLRPGPAVRWGLAALVLLAAWMVLLRTAG